MRSLAEKKIQALAISVAVTFVALAVIGGIRNYSPVPYWDMWDGYLAFYTRITHGDWTAWWAQHNEHRIVLSHILFWIDLAWLGGKGWFLIVVNYLLVAISVILFWTILKERIGRESRSALILFGAFFCIWLYSWVQHENLTWGFQSQFFLACLLPLAAFYCLHKTLPNCKIPDASSVTWLILSCVLGIASLGTMANGVLVLPLLLIEAVILRSRGTHIVTLALLAVVGPTLYFHDYHAIAAHGSLVQAVSETPLKLLSYILLYLGGPFYYFLGKGPIAQYIAQALGLFLIGSSVYFLYRSLHSPRANSLCLALLVFLLYIGGTAVGTAGGRLIFGVATTSRYMTPALFAWAALVALYAPQLSKTVRSGRILRMAIPCIILLVLMFARQLHALESHKSELFERKVAALALALQVKDQEQIETIYPDAEHVEQISREPIAKKISVFGEPIIENAIKLIGGAQPTMASEDCRGVLEKVRKIPSERKYVRVTGQLICEKSTKAVLLVKGGMVIGYALRGMLKPDLDSERQHLGFKGYMLAKYANENWLGSIRFFMFRPLD